jgi:hypothetical protein
MNNAESMPTHKLGDETRLANEIKQIAIGLIPWTKIIKGEVEILEMILLVFHKLCKL